MAASQCFLRVCALSAQREGLHFGLKRVVLRCDMGRFASWYGLFRIGKWPSSRVALAVLERVLTMILPKNIACGQNKRVPVLAAKVVFALSCRCLGICVCKDFLPVFVCLCIKFFARSPLFLRPAVCFLDIYVYFCTRMWRPSVFVLFAKELCLIWK